MKYSTLIEDMIVEGATPEMILVAVRAVERQETDALERRRAADRARQERHRTVSRDITLPNVSHGLSRPHVRVEDRTSTLDTEQEEKKDKSVPAAPSPRIQLESVLDAERADAVLEHRKRIRFPLTSHAAKLLAKDFAKCPDPNAAADEMVKNGWRGFDPKWLDKAQQRAGPQPRSNPTLDAANALMEKLNAVSPSQTEGNLPPLRLVAYGSGAG